MGTRIRRVAVLAVVLALGAFLGSTLDQWLAPSRTVPGSAGAVSRTDGVRVRVEVLNGGGVEGMARLATERLRDRGFDVVYYGNAANFGRDSSLVVDRIGSPGVARRVAEALGVARVTSEPDSSLYLDVSVVLGAEWEPRPLRQEERPGTWRAWWDLRRYFEDDSTTGPDIPASGRMADPGEDGR